MFAVALNSGSSPCSVAPSMEHVCALVLLPVCIVCVVWLLAGSSKQDAKVNGEGVRHACVCTCVYVDVLL